MTPRALFGLVAILLAIIGIVDSYYVVRQTEQAIVFQFRDVVRVVDKPGLHFKIPYLQSVEYFERRVLAVDAPAQEIMLAEQKPLEVDAFARYRIDNPLLYYQRLRGETIARERLSLLTLPCAAFWHGKAFHASFRRTRWRHDKNYGPSERRSQRFRR
jgi:membrane protease subunit HflC